jgi:hypothetical protein
MSAAKTAFIMNIANASELESAWTALTDVLARVERQRVEASLDGAPLREALAEAERVIDRLKGTVPGEASPFDETSVVVHGRGLWFRAPGQPRVDCRGRRVLRTLLASLARARRDRPGVALSNDELRRIGWPDECLQGPSVRHRIKQSMAVLRKLGMGDLLMWNKGYFLDPTIPLELVE